MMTVETVQILKGFMLRVGVHPRAAEIALRCAQGGTMVSTPEICCIVKSSRWTVNDFCRAHEIPCEKRSGRGGNLIEAGAFFAAWDEKNGGDALGAWQQCQGVKV